MTTRMFIAVVLALVAWADPGMGADFQWQGTCGTTSWYSVCAIGECSPGVARRFSNWGTESCSPTQPAFPGASDPVVMSTTVGLGSDATVGWLTVGASGVLTVNGQEVDLIAESALTNSGEIVVTNAATLKAYGGTITNDGTLVLRYNGYAGGGIFQVPVDVTLDGTGSLEFDQSGRVEEAGTLTNGSGHTIRGRGGDIRSPLVNHGLVSSDVSGGAISLTNYAKTNNGLIQAVNGGDLNVSTTITQGASGQILADGADSLVVLQTGAQLTGGTVATANDGWIWSSSASTTIADLTNSGHWGVQNGATMSVTGATLTNNGVMEFGLYTGGSGWPTLRFDGDVTVSGSGQFAFSGVNLTAGSGGAFTNGASHTVRGYSAAISAAMVNNGTVDCDTNNKSFVINGEAKVNNGTLRASGGGDLDLATTVTQGASGRIEATGTDSYVNLKTGAHVVGGTLTTSSNGKVWTTGGGVSPEVTDVTVAGYWGIQNGAVPSFSGATLTNDGTIEAGLYQGGSGSPVLHFDSPFTLAGSGELYLSGGRIATAAGVTWTNGASHTIHGKSANITASMVNRGSLVADWSGSAITVYTQTPGITNEGLIQVNDGCTLTLNGADLFTQTSDGETRVEGTLNLNGGPLDLQGGTLTGAGTIYGSVSSDGGSVSPGSSVGRLTVDDDYTQGSGGQLLVELGGTGAGEVDVLDVGGTATLGGALYVTAANGFVVQPGQQFTILEASTVTGTFAAVRSWADSDCSLGFDVTYNPSNVVITAVAGATNVFCSNFETGDTSTWSLASP